MKRCKCQLLAYGYVTMSLRSEVTRLEDLSVSLLREHSTVKAQGLARAIAEMDRWASSLLGPKWRTLDIEEWMKAARSRSCESHHDDD